MTEKIRFGKSRYGIYQFPTLNSIENWSKVLYNIGCERTKLFSEWEMKFVVDIHEKLVRGVELSEETVWKLEQLYAKYTD